MNYLIFAWIACFGYGLDGVLAKLTSRHAIKNPYLLNFLWSLFFLIFLLPLLPFHPLTFPTHWLSLIVTTVLWAGTGILYVVILSKMDISTLAPLFNIRTVFSVLLGVFWLGEALSPTQWLLVGVIILFGILVNLDEQFSLRTVIKPLMGLVLLNMFLVALYNAVLKVAINENGYWTVFYWASLLGQILLLPTIPLFNKDARRMLASLFYFRLKSRGAGASEHSFGKGPEKWMPDAPSREDFQAYRRTLKQLTFMALIALVSLLANLAANKAFEQNVALSSAIISLPVSMILAFLFSVFAPALLEKHSLKIYAIRFSAAAIMFLAALMISS